MANRGPVEPPPGPRAAAVAELSALVARLAAAGDLVAARATHAAIAALLGEPAPAKTRNNPSASGRVDRSDAAPSERGRERVRRRVDGGSTPGPRQSQRPEGAGGARAAHATGAADGAPVVDLSAARARRGGAA